MSILKVFFIGDIVGDAGCQTVVDLLPDILINYEVDFCIANAENIHEGKGINEHQIKKLYNSGVNVVTGGDHSFDKHLIFSYLNKEPRILRPHNYPWNTPGKGYQIYNLESADLQIGVINIRGNVFFNNSIRCPFQTADKIIEELQKETQIILVDFHAEATAEKYAFAYYLDGKVSAIVGTHTHCQTSDEQILPLGTGYITDIGFTGVKRSVIGMDIETSIRRFTLQIPQKYKLAEGATRIQGALFHINLKPDENLKYGDTKHIERVSIDKNLNI